MLWWRILIDLRAASQQILITNRATSEGSNRKYGGNTKDNRKGNPRDKRGDKKNNQGRDPPKLTSLNKTYEKVHVSIRDHHIFYVPIPFGEISKNEIRVHIASSTEGTDMIWSIVEIRIIFMIKDVHLRHFIQISATHNDNQEIQ